MEGNAKVEGSDESGKRPQCECMRACAPGVGVGDGVGAVVGMGVVGLGVIGLAVDGTAVDGVAVDGVAVDGVAVDGTAVDGVAVEGAAVDGVAVVGLSVVGLSVVGDWLGVGALQRASAIHSCVTRTHVRSLARSTFQTSYCYDCRPSVPAHLVSSSIPLPSRAHTHSQTPF